MDVRTHGSTPAHRLSICRMIFIDLLSNRFAVRMTFAPYCHSVAVECSFIRPPRQALHIVCFFTSVRGPFEVIDDCHRIWTPN